jgi:hypothetical protein
MVVIGNYIELSYYCAVQIGVTHCYNFLPISSISTKQAISFFYMHTTL